MRDRVVCKRNENIGKCCAICMGLKHEFVESGTVCDRYNFNAPVMLLKFFFRKECVIKFF